MATSAASATKATTKSRARCCGWLAGSTDPPARRAALAGRRSGRRGRRGSPRRGPRCCAGRTGLGQVWSRPVAVWRSKARRTASRSSSDARSAGFAHGASQRILSIVHGVDVNASSFVAADRRGRGDHGFRQTAHHRAHPARPSGHLDQISSSSVTCPSSSWGCSCSGISLAAYGAVLGASNGWLQALVFDGQTPDVCSW